MYRKNGLARLQEHIANQRSDMLHKLSTDLVRSCDLIAIENGAIPPTAYKSGGGIFA